MKLPNKGTIFKNRPTKYAWLMNYLQKMKKLSFHMISRKIVFETQSEEIKEFFLSRHFDEKSVISPPLLLIIK